MTGTVIAQGEADGWLLFTAPVRILLATDVSAVSDMLKQATLAVAEGFCLAGFVSYEAAPGLDHALSVHPGGGVVPLVWLGVYERPVHLACLPSIGKAAFQLSPWVCDTSEAEYAETIRQIKDYIFAGDTYQVNYTVRLRSHFSGDPAALFQRLVRAQKSRYSVYVDTGRLAICSASPELFFERKGRRLLSRPMKGTSARGLSFEEDRRLAKTLQCCPKNRAENVMIVDMIRNDLGRIADAGSVRASRLFELERYPTVHQMVSTVEAQTGADLFRTVEALFPCASITGAPKVRTMQIIRELEHSPRGVYTGMCGFWLPDGSARFNVAIRTVVVDRESGMAEYGTGGGVVWDSSADGEYRECFTKAAVLTQSQVAEFHVLETLLYAPSFGGWFLLEEHIRRAERTAAYFGYPFESAAMRRALDTCVAEQTVVGASLKVRWVLTEKGHMEATATALDHDNLAWKTGVAVDACRHDDVFVHHKTTRRRVYEAALARFPGCRDVILINDRGEVTESCYANVVLEMDGVLVTPPLSCGLLDGVFRRHLLEQGILQERHITRAMLRRAERVWLINSVRKWIATELCFAAEDSCRNTLSEPGQDTANSFLN